MKPICVSVLLSLTAGTAFAQPADLLIRIGLLYLKDGVWNGERLLPEGFVDFVSAPAPAWRKPEYGGLFWLNRVGAYSVPEDAYYAAGAGGQVTIIVPSLDLVVVRMGHSDGAAFMDESLNKALEQVVKCVSGVVQ
jgi:CubicO group peptidase (beta-lactamase class C family)